MAPERLLRAGLVRCLAVVLAAGCASHPPPLPAALPSSLPGAWLEPMRRCNCPGPLRANLRMEVRSPGHSAATIDGTLRAILPDTIWMTGEYGSFRPLFALLATADSAEFLLHQEARYWITPRNRVDWDSMTPPAWARALHWGLCPSSLLRSFIPDGPGKMDGNLWLVTGAIPEDSLRLEVRIDPGTSSVRRLRIFRGGVERCEARMEGTTPVGSVWIPAVLDIRVPDEGFSLRAELLAVRPIRRSDFAFPPFPRPPGWRRAREGGIVPLPDGP